MDAIVKEKKPQREDRVGLEVGTGHVMYELECDGFANNK